MADDVMRTSTTEAQTPPVGSTLPARRESRADRARRLVYRGRFAVLYLLLAMVTGVAIGAFVVLVERGSPEPAQAWSAWEPTGSGERKAAQIGDQVSDSYRLPSGKELATVTYAGPPQVTADGTTFQLGALAVRPDTSGGVSAEDDIDTFPANTTVMYTLCGLGDGCTLQAGTPTAAHVALIRREALELALYSFRYIDGVDSVLVLLPPRANTQVVTAVFLERTDVGAELSRPLDRTLTAPLTPGVGEMTADELLTVNRLTQRRFYEYAFERAPDGTPIMILSPALT